MEWPRGCHICSRSVSQLRNTKLRSPQSFIMGCKKKAVQPSPQKETLSCWMVKKMCPLLQWETLFLPYKAVCYINILETTDNLEQNLLVLPLMRHTEIWLFYGELSPNIFLNLFPLIIQKVSLLKVLSNLLPNCMIRQPSRILEGTSKNKFNHSRNISGVLLHARHCVSK